MREDDRVSSSNILSFLQKLRERVEVSYSNIPVTEIQHHSRGHCDPVTSQNNNNKKIVMAFFCKLMTLFFKETNQSYSRCQNKEENLKE